MRLAPLAPDRLGLRLAISLAWLVAAVVAAFGIRHILTTANPLVMSDGWYFVDAWLIPWQDGTLTLADLWAKRHGNHAQPVAALLFLANAKWLGLDMWAETLVAVGLAAIFCWLLIHIARRNGDALTPVARAWVGAAIVCVVFSINAQGKLSWSLVGLFYFGHCLGLLFLVLLAMQRERLRPVPVFGAALLLCVLIDTTGLLWCAAAIACLAAASLRADAGERRRQVAAIGLVAFAIAIYVPGYRWLAPPPDGPAPDPMSTALLALASQGEGAWKLFLPFGTAYARTERLATVIGPGLAQVGVIVLAVVCLAAHLWMWSLAWRRRAGRGLFVAWGLALYAYATIAGIALQRVPQFGWDYLVQPRYGVFYDFLLLAPILAWACRPAAPVGSEIARRAGFALLLLPCVLALCWFRIGFLEVPWIRGFTEDVARDTWQLMQDPARLPEDCNPFVVVCSWDEQTRRRLIGALVAHELNLASPGFRRRHRFEFEPMPARTDAD